MNLIFGGLAPPLHSWGFVRLKEGCVRKKPKKGLVVTKIKKLALKVREERELKRQTASRTSECMELRAPGIETTTRQAGPLGAGNAARRRVRRVDGVGMGLLRNDGEVEDVAPPLLKE